MNTNMDDLGGGGQHTSLGRFYDKSRISKATLIMVWMRVEDLCVRVKFSTPLPKNLMGFVLYGCHLSFI